MLPFILWYLSLLLIGWLAFPISFRFFSNLSDRGYALAKALGMLLWGFIFWLLVYLHVLPNDISGIVAAILVVASVSAVMMRKGGWKQIWKWVKENRKTIIVVEVVFLVLFASWAVVRAANPDISGTEKPMELAFINAISRSPSFPPSDPWLAGYSISYYYFGYLMISILVRFTSVSAGIGYNLAGALWFSLTAVGAYGVVFNVVRTIRKRNENAAKGSPGLFGALLGPFYVLIVSNMEGFLEVLHSLVLFWKTDPNGVATSKFWTWLGILDLNIQPSLPITPVPNRYMWWWRASRVVTQFDLAGNWKEIIDEFPFFSYLLADLHPHVLAMPFVMLAIVLALNLFIKWKDTSFKKFSLVDWMTTWEFWGVSLVIGGLAFLNTWNFLIYIGLLSAVFFVSRTRITGSFWMGIWDFVRFAVIIAIAGFILFLPYFIGLQSQAQGIYPSVNYFSRGVHFWIMFAPLLAPVFYGCVWAVIKNRKKINWVNGLIFSGSVVLALSSLSYGITMLLGAFSRLSSSRLMQMGIDFLSIHGGLSPEQLVSGSLLNRLKNPGTCITLFILLFLVWCLLELVGTRSQPAIKARDTGENTKNTRQNGTMGFIWILVLLGAGLAIFSEFFYLKDQFGWPINTYFKFYFETWVVWGIAAAVCTYALWDRLRNGWGVVFKIGWTLVTALSLIYPFLSVLDKTNNFQPQNFTLDGLYYRQKYDPDDEAAIDWLSHAAYGFVAEAIGGQYSEFARVSTESGLPTVLGWPGHEDQWRGGRNEIGTREADIQTLYQTSGWDEALLILDRYNIRYIYLGPLEWSTYSTSSAILHEEKFQENLPIVYQNDSVTIYEYQK